ncbi:MAG: CoA-binding protein [Planctomycetota bacterium]|nr:CoA-binding protein [Planctomycetota bacterium]
MADLERFLACSTFAVVGASDDRAKYGNKVLRCYQQAGRDVVPVHPRLTEVEGLTAASSLAALEEVPEAVSIITPPAVSEGVIDEAVRLGIQHVWLQPGAEHEDAMERARAAGVNVIGHGPCLLVVLGFVER